MASYAQQAEAEASAPAVEPPTGRYDYLVRVSYVDGAHRAQWFCADKATELPELVMADDAAVAFEIIRSNRVVF